MAPLDANGLAGSAAPSFSERFPEPFPPPFASAWGDDEFGLWADLEVASADTSETVTQRLRWIEPGTFVMGSPHDEPERFEWEGPQHEVTIANGFWLFDTACTQALWQAVMGSNPSSFKGFGRPVDSVSWNDVQEFLTRINEMIPGLDLVLPTEAQWEYACRAGTTTPFSFGATITPEEVNYDGNHPYAGGEKGLYRQETVSVASLPANPWGLYEMHGNVWEWCADHWHDSYQGAPTDGSAWIDEGADPGVARVLRGGSWDDYAWSVRSAYRLASDPGYRYSGIGFRCARVQGS
ncbi:MAG: formylglycine-generating enzyme family protein [Rhodospirillales bacterium]|nr:formylglycine-generating enzyme family protein [Rhodospirillales bacterium]